MSTATPDRPRRDWLVDVLRVGSVVVVVLMHWLWMRVTYAHHQIELRNSLNGRVMQALTWLLMVMPLFFIAGGMANTMIVDRCRARGQGYGEFLGLRARRLFTPLLPLLAVFAVVGFITPHLSAGIAATAAREPANVLWFLGVYVICTALAPFQVWMHDRVGWWAGPLLWLGLAGGIDALHLNGLLDGTFNMLAVWPACHALGVLYQRRTLWRAPTWLLGAGALACSGWIALTVRLGWFAPENIGLADNPAQNLMPPGSVLAWLGVVQLLLLTPLARRLEFWTPKPLVQRVIGALNALLMHLYLWHVPVLVIATGIGMLAPAFLLPVDPAVWWATRLIWIPAQAAALAGIVLLASRWDLFMRRFGAQVRTLPVVTATAIGCTATYFLWKGGLSAAPGSLAAGAGIMLAVGLLTTRRRTLTGREPTAEFAVA